MFFTQHEIAQSRDDTLNNLLGISTACLNAGEQLSELFANNGRAALHASREQLSQLGDNRLDTLNHFPAALWLEHSSRTSKLLGTAYEIIGEAHKMLIQGTEAQIRVFDEIGLSSLQRLSRNSPWEAGLALNAMQQTLTAAEQALRGISSAAVGSVALAEQEVQQITETLSEQTEQKPQAEQKPKAAPRSRSKAN